MKTLYRNLILAIIAVVGVGVGLVSCGNDGGWIYENPDNYKKFYDPTITGYWRLAQVDGQAVAPKQENFLYFNGNGGGNFYFYENGAELVQQIRYNCQTTPNSLSQTQLNISYGGAPERVMMYWKSGDGLWMQWIEGKQVTTYVYRPISQAPW